jgi:hypothetical protein
MKKRISMGFIQFIIKFFKISEKFSTVLPKKKDELYMKIKDISEELPKGPGRFGTRKIEKIGKIIVHQSMADADTNAINRYHISANNHIKKGGCPKICYHYTIEKDGMIYKVNDPLSITWHCAGHNTTSIGICVLGNFDGPSYIGGSGSPTKRQTKSLGQLLDNLKSTYDIENINMHSDFGKENCPGYDLEKFVREYNNSGWKVK